MRLLLPLFFSLLLTFSAAFAQPAATGKVIEAAAVVPAAAGISDQAKGEGSHDPSLLLKSLHKVATSSRERVDYKFLYTPSCCRMN